MQNFVVVIRNEIGSYWYQVL